VARHATDIDHPLLASCVGHLGTNGVSDRAERDRLGNSRRLLARIRPSMRRWHDRSTAWSWTSAASEEWPLLYSAILRGRAQVDVALLVAFGPRRPGRKQGTLR
jgi:hypothetical protein